MIESLLQVGRNALLAHHAAVQIIGQNIANAETPGYVRQRPVLSAVPGSTSGSLGGAALGNGVELTDVQRLQDLLLQAQVERQSGRAGFYLGRRAALEQVQSLFTDLQAGGLSSALSDFFGSWTDLAADPGNLATRAELLERAEILADSFNETATALQDMRRKFDTQVGDKVREVNRLAAQVAELNRQLISADEPTVSADLQTAQDVAVQELSSLLGAEAIRYDNGTADIIVGGQRLVQGSRAVELTTVADPADPSVSQVVFAESDTPVPLGGEIAGLIDARDNYVPGYRERLDTLASALAVEVNALHAQGVDLDDAQGGDFFTYGSSDPARTLRLSPAGVKHHLATGAASDHFTAADTAVGTLLGLATPPAGSVQINGVAVALDLATQSLDDLAAAINAAAIPDLTASVVSEDLRGETVYRLQLTGASDAPALTDEGAVLATLGVLFAGVEDRPEALAAGRSTASGEGGNALALADLRDDKVLSGGQNTLEQYFADVLAEVGTDTAGAASLEKSAALVSESLEAQLQSQTGVSLDEEGVELIRYQQAYLAAQKVISVALQMLDSLFSLVGG